MAKSATTSSKSRRGTKGRAQPTAKTTGSKKSGAKASSRSTAKTSRKSTSKAFGKSPSRASERGATAKKSTPPRKTATAGKSASTAARSASKQTVAQATSKQRRGAKWGVRSASKAAASKKSVARSAPSSRKGSSAKSVSKRINQRRRPQTAVARNEVALANPVTEAVAVTAEVTAGAIEATGKIAAAAADMARSAAETLGTSQPVLLPTRVRRTGRTVEVAASHGRSNPRLALDCSLPHEGRQGLWLPASSVSGSICAIAVLTIHMPRRSCIDRSPAFRELSAPHGQRGFSLWALREWRGFL